MFVDDAWVCRACGNAYGTTTETAPTYCPDCNACSWLLVHWTPNHDAIECDTSGGIYRIRDKIKAAAGETVHRQRAHAHGRQQPG